MRNLLFLFILGFISVNNLYGDTYVETEDTQVIWVGPGNYYGVYFWSEESYNHWYANNAEAVHNYNQQYRESNQQQRQNNRQGNQDSRQDNRESQRENRRSGSGGGRR